VVSAVAETTCTDPLGLSPLCEVIDPDALNRVFAVGPESDRSEGAHITFPFEGCWITVRSDGEIIVASRGEPNVPRRGIYRARHEWAADTRLDNTLLRALEGVSRERDSTPTAPLAATIDPDSLDRLFRPLDDRSRRNAGWVSFSFDERAVTVEASGRIRIGPASRSPMAKGEDGPR
jgi:hypothetical protein